MKMFGCKDVAYYLICIMIAKFVTSEQGRMVHNNDKQTHLRLPRHIELPTESVITHLNHQISRSMRRLKNFKSHRENDFSDIKDKVHENVDGMAKKVRHRKEHKTKQQEKRSGEEDVEYKSQENRQQSKEHYNTRMWTPVKFNQRNGKKEAKSLAHQFANDETHKIKKAKELKPHIHKNQNTYSQPTDEVTEMTSLIQKHNHRNKNKQSATTNQSDSTHSSLTRKILNLIKKQKEQIAKEKKVGKENFKKTKSVISHVIAKKKKDIYSVAESRSDGNENNSGDTMILIKPKKNKSLKIRNPQGKPTGTHRKRQTINPKKYFLED